MSRLTALALVVLATACTPLATWRLENLALPATHNNCCWQALQQLTIRHQGETREMQAVVARTDGSTQLVLLGPFGHRLATVTQRGDVLAVQLAAGAPEKLPAAAIYRLAALTWLPHEELAPLSEGLWQLHEAPNARELRHKGRAVASVSYHAVEIGGSAPPLAELVYDARRATPPLPARAELVHHRARLTVSAITLTWERLP